MTSSTQVKVFPAKHFFVEMLTRDITLADAILDLLDNCVDGVRRTHSHKGDKPYVGFYADIRFDAKEFSITDNCGGISKKDASEYALMFGRPTNASPKKDGTIGLVGIGMKRAMFKLGNHCFIHSHHKQDTFDVEITPAWLKNDKDWELTLETAKPRLSKHGTKIRVSGLRDSVAEDFAEGSAFRLEFPFRVAEAFSLLIERGFEVKVNGVAIKGSIPHLLWEPAVKGQKEFIRPYTFRDNINGVDVFLAFGFREPDKDDAGDRSSQIYQTPLAGWTVSCNDRIVLYCDKSEVTGWGAMNLPQYHTQFIYLSGVVEFHSNDTKNLPFTTTKRGVDQASVVFLKIRERMIEALRQFMTWTNEWKERPAADRRQLFRQAASKPVHEIRQLIEREYRSTSAKLGQPIKPKLPKAKVSTTVNILFQKNQSDVDRVSRYLFDDEEKAAKVVGEECFDRTLRESKL